MAMQEDLSVFFSPSEFADTATLGGVAVTAIFDKGFALGNVGAYGMVSTQPTLTLATANVPASPEGQAAVVNGVAYLVASHEPDGTGVSRLMLEKAA